jgi:hypothetical protein
MHKTVWKAWAPPKDFSLHGSSCKIEYERQIFYKKKEVKLWSVSFAQASHGVGLPRLHQLPFIIRLWHGIKAWLDDVHPNQWSWLTVQQWWSTMIDGFIPNCKAMAPSLCS